MDEKIKVISPKGLLDSLSGNQLRRQVNDLVDLGSIFILINCENIELVDSSGLSALVMSLQKVRGAGGELGLCAINDQIRMLLELTAMDDVLRVFPGAEAFSEMVSFN